MGTINKISPKLDPSTNNDYNMKLLPLSVIRQVDKDVSIKTNSFSVLQHVLCCIIAWMKLIAFEFGNVLLVKSTATALTVFS